MTQSSQQYQVLARKYRPKAFRDVIGQEAIVTTLKNALQEKRLHHAYLFSGPRGTGKTTLARILAKAMNCEKIYCENLKENCEPCSTCGSCLEIASGASLDVIEIDGASNRGIDDIRLITDSAGYAPSRGRYKIYIIDEVHMLTKEAFNALLKTLEEPPPAVKFFFATTEPHKVPETIVSRCQRFNVKRIPITGIFGKLSMITKDLKLQADDAALRRIAQYAEGGLRDAESLFDQMIAFSDGTITLEMVTEALGLMPSERLFEFDDAYACGNFEFAFQMTQELFANGKDLTYFLNDLTRHFRTILLLQISPKSIGEVDPAYQKSKELYSKEALMTILEHIVKAHDQMKTAVALQMSLEVLLLKILREKERISIATLVKKLSELEKEIGQKPELPPLQPAVDPRLEILPSLQKKVEPVAAAAPSTTESAPAAISAKNSPRYDTLMQFAATELEGTLQRKR
ncbi:MAG TPA: DNA polymerase III subunit gamma/tau [Chlamydiales bacterium]|nr:DNA polymerase III subunit gamma/tau [Chlamydiales bacterium]